MPLLHVFLYHGSLCCLTDGQSIFISFSIVIYFSKMSCLCLRRGSIVTTFIVCYALTSFISGYVNGGMYSRSGGNFLH